jgi:hypothetical protein
MVHPEGDQVTGLWLADEPFHIREGFVNNREEPLGAAFPPDYDFQVFITRRQGPPLDGGAFAIDTPYRYTADFLVRESSDRCGPAFLDQTEPLPCDEFVHDFPEGLPPGRYQLWVEWQAPCSAWTTVDVCDEDDTPLTLFAARADIAFYHDDYTPDDDGLSGFGALWPIDDPWEIETEPAG